MKSLKKFTAFIILLTSMLLAFSLYLNITKSVDNYKKSIIEDYSIVVVSSTPLIKEDISKIAGISVKSIVTLNKNEIVKKFKNRLSPNSLELLKIRLPHFYKIYLESFPTTSQLKVIKAELQERQNIATVETFSKNHSTTYLLLSLLNKIVLVLFFIIFLFAILILSKEIKLWFYEHAERLSIMKLHGASTLYSARPIIKTAILSSVISFIITVAILYTLSANLDLFLFPELKEILYIDLLNQADLMKVFILSILVSVLTILGVLIQHKIK